MGKNSTSKYQIAYAERAEFINLKDYGMVALDKNNKAVIECTKGQAEKFAELGRQFNFTVTEYVDPTAQAQAQQANQTTAQAAQTQQAPADAQKAQQTAKSGGK